MEKSHFLSLLRWPKSAVGASIETYISSFMQSWNLEAVLDKRSYQTICFEQTGGSCVSHCSPPCRIWFCLSCKSSSATKLPDFSCMIKRKLLITVRWWVMSARQAILDAYPCATPNSSRARSYVPHPRVDTIAAAQRKSEYITFKHSSNHPDTHINKLVWER